MKHEDRQSLTRQTKTFHTRAGPIEIRKREKRGECRQKESEQFALAM